MYVAFYAKRTYVLADHLIHIPKHIKSVFLTFNVFFNVFKNFFRTDNVIVNLISVSNLTEPVCVCVFALLSRGGYSLHFHNFLLLCHYKEEMRACNKIPHTATRGTSESVG